MSDSVFDLARSAAGVSDLVRRYAFDDQGCCMYCEAPHAADAGFERDHFPVPACAGGKATVWACAKCHDYKDRRSDGELFAWAQDALEWEWSHIVHGEIEWRFIRGDCSIIDPTAMDYLLSDIRDFHPRVRVVIAAQIFGQLRAIHRWQKEKGPDAVHVEAEAQVPMKKKTTRSAHNHEER